MDQTGGGDGAAPADAPADFLRRVSLKIVFDLLGLAMLAAPSAMLPAWLPRTAGIGVTMLAHGAFVMRCTTTFKADGGGRRGGLGFRVQGLGFRVQTLGYLGPIIIQHFYLNRHG